VVRIAFLGCGFITRVHSRHLKALGGIVVPSYASRDGAKAEAFSAQYGGACSYGDYAAAIADPKVDAVVVAVPPYLHQDLTLQALAAGKHVLVEKPAFPSMDGYRSVLEARNRARRVVLIGENDHYKPLAVRLRKLLGDGVIGDLVFGHFTTIAEEGIHWLHLAGSLGPRILTAHGFRPTPSREGPDTRVKSMMVAFEYDNGAVGSLYYSREVPSLFRGLRLSKLFGREGVISFESNGTIMVVRGRGLPRLTFPGFRDIRGYQAMYRDFHRAISTGAVPEMSLERAMDDQRLMDQIYASLAPAGPMAVAR
jgi:predicted dehydrogenase